MFFQFVPYLWCMEAECCLSMLGSGFKAKAWFACLRWYSPNNIEIIAKLFVEYIPTQGKNIFMKWSWTVWDIWELIPEKLITNWGCLSPLSKGCLSILWVKCVCLFWEAVLLKKSVINCPKLLWFFSVVFSYTTCDSLAPKLQHLLPPGDWQDLRWTVILDQEPFWFFAGYLLLSFINKQRWSWMVSWLLEVYSRKAPSCWCLYGALRIQKVPALQNGQEGERGLN